MTKTAKQQHPEPENLDKEIERLEVACIAQRTEPRG